MQSSCIIKHNTQSQTHTQTMQAYSRLQYSGYEFRTAASQSSVKFDNSNVRVPIPMRRGRLEQHYGSISAIFTHQAWPSGPEVCVLELDWYTNLDVYGEPLGKSEVSGNPLVGPPGNSGVRKFAEIGTCYQIPIAIWPHDPLHLKKKSDSTVDVFEVIDRNQDEDA